MKKVCLLLLLVLFFTRLSFSQFTTQYVVSRDTTGVSPSKREIGSGTTVRFISWNISGGTFSACSVKAEQSANNLTFSDLGTGNTCTSNGVGPFVTGVVNFSRISFTLTVGSGTPVLIVNYVGYDSMASGLLNIQGTANQITSSGPGVAPILSLPSPVILPGAIQTPQYMDFDNIVTPSAPASGRARIFAQDAQGVTRMLMETSPGNVLSFFRDAVARGRNITGGTINKGAAVYINGSTGTVPTVAKARADVISTAGAIGLAISSIASPAFGTIQTQGQISGINTSAYTEGDRLYLSAVTAGALTNVIPVAPNLIRQIGFVITSHAVNGVIFIDPDWGAPSGTLTSGSIPFAGTDGLLNQNNSSLFWVDATGVLKSTSYGTVANCADGTATPADCASAPDGHVIISAGATSVVVNTTRVTANSEIFIQEDSSLGALLGVTCNTTIVRLYTVTARTVGTFFTITTSAAPIIDPACLGYKIEN